MVYSLHTKDRKSIKVNYESIQTIFRNKKAETMNVMTTRTRVPSLANMCSQNDSWVGYCKNNSYPDLVTYRTLKIPLR